MNNLSELNGSLLQQNASGKASHTLKYQSSLSTSQDISIKTKEGDIVTISLDSKSREEMLAYDYASDLKREAGKQYSSLQSDSLNISVQGDLSEEEQKEINEILKKTDSLMKSLINGDKEALAKGMDNILKDGGTIAEFQSRMEYHQSTYIEERISFKNTYMDEDLFNEAVDTIGKNIRDLLEHSKVEAEKSVPAVTDYLKKLSKELDEENPFNKLHNQAIDRVKEQINSLIN